ncbi:L-threonylcarbamoyladenylate synthase [Prolixibacter denitrificans]|uniref:L-threonylcarbamoyladenylate synthase n=1 Tax=Prolixibacter denitrificans TaxID=1541063 RepID=A0A2P8CKV2_9BACT|nr:L-threonylcarbamoyladenylate synthase [Prolixibacter denitrificans]PSK85598.1 L-threonylcarbamoyladenylate synthase [Prolixibacter denitrificans]GET20218.1 threonylcarbamoyl-AMP synthase [Prolixibacter denitrificans]
MESDFREDIRQALEVLKKGGIILYPTDTIWGIGCDATNADSVARVSELKKRESSRSMLVLMENPNLLNSYIEEVPEVAWDLIDVADKPLTIVYPGAKNLATNLIAEDGSIGIRITEEPFTQQLIQRFHKPLVSTSANISGEPSPAFFDEVSPEIVEGVDYVVQYRQEERMPTSPSSVIRLGVSGEVQILRK